MYEYQLENEEDPAQVPGRTITESELRRIAEDSAGPGASTVMPYIKATVEALSITIVPDPEPTNFEKLTIYLGLHDLDAITNDGVTEFARQLDADGVKAPEANHEIQ